MVHLLFFSHCFTLIQAYIPTQLIVEADHLSRYFGSQVAPASLHSSGCISSLGSTRGGFLGILTYQSISVLLHLGKSSTSAGLGVECFQPPLAYQVSCMFPPPTLVPLVYPVPGKLWHRSTEASYAYGTLLDGHSLDSHNCQKLEDILQCPILKNPIMDVVVGQMLKESAISTF